MLACRDRNSRILLALLPIFGKGYTEAQTKTAHFKARAIEVLQDALACSWTHRMLSLTCMTSGFGTVAQGRKGKGQLRPASRCQRLHVEVGCTRWSVHGGYARN
jgi:hypothetical protein